MTIINKILLVGFTSLAILSCRKIEDTNLLRDIKKGGCFDIDSPLYDATVDYENQTCQYAFTQKYEISFYPQEDGGSDWDYFLFDPLGYRPADLILKIKEKGVADWIFESSTKEDQAYNVPAIWAAPTATKLLNKTYEWELYDEDNGTADDFVAGGTFNPIGLAKNGEIIIANTTGQGQTQLKIYYELKEEI